MTEPTPSFRRFANAKPTEKLADPVEVKQATVVKDVPPATAVTPIVERKNAVSVFAKPSGANALAAFAEVADEKPQFDLFPVVGVTGGPNGGLFDPAKHLAAELKRLLPSGRNPIQAVVLAYRVALVAFPQAANDDVPAGGKRPRPEWTCVIPSHEAEAMKVATKLTKNYQFTKRVNKGKYDFDKTGVGHVKPTLCLLCYLPMQNMLVEVRTPNHYNSVERTGNELGPHFNADGALEPFPCELEVESTAEGKDTPNPWTIHHILFKPVTNDKKKEMGDKFAAWQGAAQDDAELVGNYNKWITCADRPLTDEIAQRIQKGVAV